MRPGPPSDDMNEQSCEGRLCPRSTQRTTGIKILSCGTFIATKKMSHIIICYDLGLHIYNCYTHHLLFNKLKEIQNIRFQNLLDECDDKKSYHHILFTDEKFFTIEESFSKQNDRVYARSSVEACKKVLCAQ